MADGLKWNSSPIPLQRGKDGIVAEPMHRVGPQGVSSGISFRQLPETSFEQIQKICQHYVKKCSGKYENNQMAARYVHQLAEEVLSLLGGIAEEIEVNREIRKLAEERLSDWDRNFPVSLKVLGGPKDIAERLLEMQTEINHLHQTIDNLEFQLQTEREKAVTTIDEQLHLSSVGIAREREQLSQEMKQLRREYEEKLKDFEAQYAENLDALHSSYHRRLTEDERKHMDQMTQQKEELERIRKIEVKKLQEELQRERERRESGTRDERARINDLQRTIKKLNARIEVEEREGENEETTLSLSEDTKNEARKGKQENEDPRRNGRRTRLEMKRRMNSLQQTLAAIEASNQEKDLQIQSLSETISKLSQELSISQRKIENQKHHIECLHFSLKTGFPSSSGRDIVSEPSPLQFIVPDFLKKQSSHSRSHK